MLTHTMEAMQHCTKGARWRSAANHIYVSRHSDSPATAAPHTYF